MFNARYVILLIFLILSNWAHAQGGPPLVTDDPGTPGDHHWEINLALATWHGNGQSGLLSSPYADVNYGWGDRIQLKFETGMSFLREGNHTSASGIVSGIAGIKYRFVDEEEIGFAVSMYPQMEFPYFFAHPNQDLTDPATHLILPLEIAKSFGVVSVTSDIGYVHSTLADDEEIFYGAALAFAIADKKELLAEIHFTDQLTTRDAEIFYNLGTRWKVAENVSVIGSVGRTIKNFTNDPPREMFWLGAQLIF